MTKKLSPTTLANPVASEVIRLSEGNRLQIPRPILKLLSWFDGQSTHGIIAERRELGCIRLHLQQRIEPKIQTLRKAIEAHVADNPGFINALFALEDRYRCLTLYHDGRVRLTEAVLLHLDIVPGDFPFVLVQATTEYIDVLSQRLRSERLIQFCDETSIDTDDHDSVPN